MSPARQETNSARRTSSGGRDDYLHVAVDDHSRYAYGEALKDEKGIRLPIFSCGLHSPSRTSDIPVGRVTTDNGSCHRSQAIAAPAMLEVTLKTHAALEAPGHGKRKQSSKRKENGVTEAALPRTRWPRPPHRLALDVPRDHRRYGLPAVKHWRTRGRYFLATRVELRR